MRVLVTGGLGFLGYAVTRDLVAEGHRVTAMTRGRGDAKPLPGADIVVGDIRDRGRVEGIVRAGEFDAIAHLAALTRARDSLADPLTYFDVNTGGTLNLLMALDAVRGDVPSTALVFASTNIVYGSQHTGALSEDLDPHPESPYAESKVAAEQMVAAYAAAGGVGAVTVRPFNVAGSVDGVGDTDPNRIIPNIFRAMTGELDHLTLNGDGSAVRDFVHVADVAAGIRLALTATVPGTHQIVNLGSGVGASMAEVVATAEKVTGRSVPVRHMPPKPEPPYLVGAIDKGRDLLGWKPVNSSLTQILQDAWHAWLWCESRPTEHDLPFPPGV